MNARRQLGAALTDLLPITYRVWPYPKAMFTTGSKFDAELVIERRQVDPASTTGSYDETYYVWVLVTETDEELAEDALDDALEVVQGALDGINWCTPPRATRDMYGDLHGYRLEIQLKTTKEKTP